MLDQAYGRRGEEQLLAKKITFSSDKAAFISIFPAQLTDDLESVPKFEAHNVMSILVSAFFLKMDTLVSKALAFAHDNMNKVLVATQNLNCLGEPLLTKCEETQRAERYPGKVFFLISVLLCRLANQFSPSEVEELLDRRDRIHSKLYVKLIQSLFEPLPQPDRDIFFTAATFHRCKLCGSFLTQRLAKVIPCLPSRYQVTRRGEVIPKHLR